MNVIVMDYQENFIRFLDNDLLDITETYEVGGIRYIDVEYYMEEIADAKKLFSIGNKIWVQGDKNLTDCLYVINTEVTRDYFKENNVKFTAEDCIVELNYTPFFKQTDLTTKNGFKITTTNNENNVTVNYNALNFWFGDYFQIGIVQDTLNTDIAKISPKGTMTKMELLRYIEEETCNIFIPRYEKDPENNTIHRFLDYLNPNSSDNNWEIHFKWTPTNTTDITSETTIGPYDDVNDETDIVNLPPYTPPVNHDPSDIKVSLKTGDGEEIISWNAADDLGVDDDSDIVNVAIKYEKPLIKCIVDNKTYTASAPTLPDREIDTSTNDVISMLPESTEFDPDLYTTVHSEETLTSDTVLPNHTVFEVYDEETETLLFYHELNPLCGDVHEDILDLGYNVENIKYTVNEEDTYTAIAPKFSTENTEFTKADYDTIINNWVNLAVNKGDKIPMILEKVTTNLAPTSENLALSVVSSNYYARPLHPNDDANNTKYEYWQATAYWNAPFNKRAGELHIEDYDDTGVEYNHIQTRPDTVNPYGIVGTPKMGIVETSDENKYAIYNDVAMKLKDKRFPEVDIEVDVANYKQGKYNDYAIYDKVYVKVPGFEGLLTTRVDKTTKKAHDISKNTVELSNFSVNTKVATKETMITGDNQSWKYPKKGTLEVTLKDISSSETAVANKLINFTIYKNEDNNTTYLNTYTKKTGSDGKAKITINRKPGNYIVEVNFGGDIEYSPSNTDYEVNITGTTETTTTTTSTSKENKGKKYKTVKTYWTKCGLSPDKKEIIAVAQPSGWDYQNKKDANGKKLKYQQLYRTVFKNVCPYCGKTGSLRFDDGKVKKGNKCVGKRNVPEGEITCSSCDCDFDAVTGIDKQPANRRLKVTKKPVKSSKSEKALLIKGQLQYGTKKVEVKETKNSKRTTTHTPVGTVNKKVKEWALKKVGNKTGAAAAKALAKAVGNIRYDGYTNFVRSPSTVLSKGGGNCCDQARLYLMSCDAVGVSETYTLKYVHVCCNRTSHPGVGHVFCRLVHKSTGKSVYVDPTCSPWWGTHLKSWGSPPGKQTNYPKSPI